MRIFSAPGWPIAIVGLLMIFTAVPAATASEFSDSQKAEIQKIVGDYLKAHPDFIRQYLLDNPEVLLEVSDKLRQKQVQQDRADTMKLLVAHKDQLERNPMTPVSGNPDGDVTLIEFFDYNCPYCKRVLPVMRKMEADDPKLRLVWKEYPILSGRAPASMTAAKVAMAADRQGKYVETHDALMATRSLTSDEQVFKVAESVGLDMDKLKKDMDSPEIKKYISDTIQLGQVLKFQGTPTFVINGAVIGGAVPKKVLLAVIAAARAGALQPGELDQEALGKIVQKYGS